jgi:hypothetical protein
LHSRLLPILASTLLLCAIYSATIDVGYNARKL